MERDGSKRRSTRLRGYDYSTPGAYFITTCSHNRLLLFGRIVNSKVEANRLGAVVEDCWAELPDHYDNIALDAFILMPNHIHGVIIIKDTPTVVGAGLQHAAEAMARSAEDTSTVVGAGLQPALPAAVGSRRHSVPEIVRAFKTFSARRINEMRASTGTPVWQRGFYDHIIRSESELDRVRIYIMDNPRRWSEDADNPANWRG